MEINQNRIYVKSGICKIVSNLTNNILIKIFLKISFAYCFSINKKKILLHEN